MEDPRAGRVVGGHGIGTGGGRGGPHVRDAAGDADGADVGRDPGLRTMVSHVRAGRDVERPGRV